MPYKDPAQQRAAQAAWYAKHKANDPTKFPTKQRERRALARRFVTESKTNKPCADCGVIYPPYVMDYDHVRGSKKSNLANLCRDTGTLDAIKAEIAKCELVCSNCHRERTWQRKHGPVEE